MAGQMEFMEAIRELERIAETNGKQLTMEEIENYFMDMHLDKKQFDFICKYYEGHNISIINRVEKMEDISEEEIKTKVDPLDEEMVAIYMKETDKSSRLSEDQIEKIACKITAGDENARNLLIESNLSYAVEIAKRYKGKGLQLSDLIQESNIGLMMAVNEYEPGIHKNFLPFAEKMICRQIEESLEEYNHSTRSAMKITNRVNELNEIVSAFAKEYEREPKPGEIADRMGISEDQVRELMKVSLDAIAILDENKMGN